LHLQQASLVPVYFVMICDLYNLFVWVAF